MANNRWDALRGSIGFYATMAVFLVAIGISGYFLLLNDHEEEPPLPPDSVTEQTPVHAPVAVVETPEAPESPAELPVVETISPDPVEIEVTSIPETEVPSTPVIPEPPRTVVAPLQGEVLTVFSVDELLYNETLEDWRIHDGVDIAAEVGAPVLAACAGTVHTVSTDTLMGTCVVIDHADGHQTSYANLQENPPVAAGQSVSAGQAIGTVGTSAAAEAAQGPHLHFSVTRDGDVVDPHEFLKG